jgi:hypothetical protein
LDAASTSERNGLSPFVHRYPRWIAHELAEAIDCALCADWWDSTGVFDGTAIRRAWLGIRAQPDPHPQTAYVLICLCALRRMMEEVAVMRRPREPRGGRAGPPTNAAPPWGFPGRALDGRWRRIAALPRQAADAARCLTGRPAVVEGPAAGAGGSGRTSSPHV